MPKKLKKARIKFLSLVPKGANKFSAIYKEDGSIQISPLAKFDEEKGELTAVVYAPNLLDAQDDFADEEVIKDAAYNFAKDKGNIDIRHDEKAIPVEKAFVAESFIIQKGDPRFSSFEKDVTGGWGVVIKIEDEEIRRLYKEGKWSGISMGGTGIREDASEDDLKSILKEILQERKMALEEKDVKKMIEDNNTTLLKELKDLLTEKSELKGKEKEVKKSLVDELKEARDELIRSSLIDMIKNPEEGNELTLEKIDQYIEALSVKKKKPNRLSNLGLLGENNGEGSQYESIGKQLAKDYNEGKI